jgi:hypothetical protein
MQKGSGLLANDGFPYKNATRRATAWPIDMKYGEDRIARTLRVPRARAYSLAAVTAFALTTHPVAALAQNTVGNAALPRDLTPWGMFVNADKVVKAVLIGLAFASVITWTLSPHAISGCAARSNNVFSTSAVGDGRAPCTQAGCLHQVLHAENSKEPKGVRYRRERMPVMLG